MKRMILALAVASLSFAALAGPPGPPTRGPVDVNVVNPALSVNVGNQPLSVAVQPSKMPLSQLFVLTRYDRHKEENAQYPYTPLATDVVLTGVYFAVQLTPAASDFCSLLLGVIPSGELAITTFAQTMVVPGNGIASGYVPLPNIYVVAGSKLVESIVSPPPLDAPDWTCYMTRIWYGFIPD